MAEFLNRVKQDRLFITLLVLFTALLYGRTLGFDFAWDDLLYVLGSDVYRNFELKGMLLGLGNGVEYLPVRDLTFALDFLLWGERPAGFHLSNLLFYSATVVLVYLATIRLMAHLRSGLSPALIARVAFLTAGLFALHPLHVEPVCFVNGRNTLVAGMFFFCSLLAYLHYLESGQKRMLMASLMAFGLAVFSKAITIVLPLLLALFLITVGKRLKPHLPGIVPFFLVALMAFVVFREVAQSTYVITPDQAFEIETLSLGSRLATALQIPFFYLAKFIAPINLSVDYSPDFSASLLSMKAAVAFLALSLFTGIAYIFRRRFPEGLFALLAYLALLLPVSNLFLTSPVVADRYAFLPIYPLCLLLASLLALKLRGTWLIATGAVLCLVLGLISFSRSSAWVSDEALWQATLHTSPDSALAIFNLSNNYFDQGRYELAVQTMERLANLYPYSISPEVMQARVALRRGERSRAIEILENAMIEKESNAEAYVYLAEAYEAKGHPEQALGYYSRILQSEETALRERRAARARIKILRPMLLADFQADLDSVRKSPADSEQITQLAIRLDAAGLDEEALALYHQLERVQGPHWAMSLNIGSIYSGRGELEEAADYFRESINLNQDNPKALNELGIVLRSMEDYEGAENAFLEAIRLAPEYDKAPLNLAVMYLRLGREKEARHYFEYVAERFPAHRDRVEGYISRM